MDRTLVGCLLVAVAGFNLWSSSHLKSWMSFTRPLRSNDRQPSPLPRANLCAFSCFMLPPSDSYTSFISWSIFGIMLNLDHHQSARLSAFVEFISPQAHYWIWFQSISSLIPLALQSPFHMICLYYLSLLLLWYRTVWPSAAQQTKAL